jgi:hypothetical protein
MGQQERRQPQEKPLEQSQGYHKRLPTVSAAACTAPAFSCRFFLEQQQIQQPQFIIAVHDAAPVLPVQLCRSSEALVSIYQNLMFEKSGLSQIEL